MIQPQATIFILSGRYNIIYKPVTNIFLKLELKQRLKLFKTLRLQKALQSPLRRNKIFMNGFLKSVLHRMKRNTKMIKIFSKKLKIKQRKYTATINKLLKCTGNIKKIWNVIKQQIGKSKIESTNLPLKFTINKVHVYNKPEIADGFNYFFRNIIQKLASQIPKSSEVIVIMNSKPLSLNGLKAAFFSLKINERSGADDISFNIIKKCFEVLCEP